MFRYETSTFYYFFFQAVRVVHGRRHHQKFIILGGHLRLQPPSCMTEFGIVIGMRKRTTTLPNKIAASPGNRPFAE